MKSDIQNLVIDRTDKYISALNQSMTWCLSLALLAFVTSILGDKGIKIGSYTFSKEMACLLVSMLFLVVCYQQNKIASFFLAFIGEPSRDVMVFALQTHQALFNPFYENNEPSGFWHSIFSSVLLPVANMILLSFVLILYFTSMLPYLLNSIPDPSIELLFPGFMVVLGGITFLLRNTSKKYLVLLEKTAGSEAFAAVKIKAFLAVLKIWFVINMLILICLLAFAFVGADWGHILGFSP